MNRIDIKRAGETLRRTFRSGLLPDQCNAFLTHDVERMRGRLNAVTAAFPPHSLHTLAIKANPLVELLKIAVAEGFGLEAASIEEVHLAVAAGCSPDRIAFDSPAKTVAELAECMELGVHLNLDNMIEVRRVGELMGQIETQSTFGIRVNAEVGAGSIAHTSVGAMGSKFGVSISKQGEELIQAYREYPWLTGIHTHIGSQGCEIEMLVDGVTKVNRLRQKIAGVIGREIPRFDIGGGLPAAYTKADEAPTFAEYAEQLQAADPDLFAPQVTLMTEFGRSIQAGCGLGFSRVETVRDVSHDQQLAVLHLGADFLLRPVYRSESWQHEFFVFDAAGNVRNGEMRRTTLAGPLCFSGDLIAKDIPFPKLESGDWVAIRDCGAYTLSMWSRHCNRSIPAVLGVDLTADRVAVLRQAETPAEMVRFWSA